MLAAESMNLTQPHEASTERPRMTCPFSEIEVDGKRCEVKGTVQGIRRHVSHAHGLSKTDRDALINSILTRDGRSHEISAAGRKSEGAKLATAVHWAETLPDTELRKAARKMGWFVKNDTPRDELIAGVKERAAKKGLMAVPN
jgi:hypothetical protein